MSGTETGTERSQRGKKIKKHPTLFEFVSSLGELKKMVKMKRGSQDAILTVV